MNTLRCWCRVPGYLFGRIWLTDQTLLIRAWSFKGRLQQKIALCEVARVGFGKNPERARGIIIRTLNGERVLFSVRGYAALYYDLLERSKRAQGQGQTGNA